MTENLDKKYNKLLKLMICADFKNSNAELICNCDKEDKNEKIHENEEVINIIIDIKNEITVIMQKIELLCNLLSYNKENNKDNEKNNNNGDDNEQERKCKHKCAK